MTIKATLTNNTQMTFGRTMSISLDDGTYGYGKLSGSIAPNLSWQIDPYPLCCALFLMKGFYMQGGILRDESYRLYTPAYSGAKFFALLESDRDRLVKEIKGGFAPIAKYFKSYGGITGVIAYHSKDEWPYWDKFVELLCEILDLKFEQAMVVQSNHAAYPCIQFNAVTREYKGDIISEIMPMSLRNAERAA